VALWRCGGVVRGAVVQFVEALRYKPEGRGFVDVILPDMTHLLIQPLTQVSTRNISWGQRRPVRRADLSNFKCQLS
jgi:hypothetical protein